MTERPNPVQPRATILTHVGSEVALSGTEQLTMQSRIGNRKYQIMVAKPQAKPPATGYAVIYVLDANAVFATMVETMRVQSRVPDKTGVTPAIVVGIGYHTDAPFDPARHYDYTLPVSLSDLPARPDGREWPEHGGAEDFLTFIEEDLKPTIESRYSIDTSRQTIFGHSLGGLFVLHTLFTKPDAFRTYIAGSPSIHWNKRVMLDEEQQFTARLEQEAVQVSVLIAAGELERAHKSRINDNAEEMVGRLSSLADRGVEVEFKEFAGEAHLSVLPVLISRALRFASQC